jgi:Tol biopolymer transport system component
MRRTLAVVVGAWLVLSAPAGAGAVPAASTLRLASITAAGVKSNRTSDGASVSADGGVVAFETIAANLDPRDRDSQSDIYAKNLRTGSLMLASTNGVGVKGNSASYAPSISADGTKVAFESYANNFDPRDKNFDLDIYVKDITTGSIALASASTSGEIGNGGSYFPGISGDGTKVAFYSDATNFIPGVFHRQIWEKDLASGVLTLVSATASGQAGNADSGNSVLSFDGSAIAFSTLSTNFDQRDTDFTADVYEKSLATGALTLVSTSSTGLKGNDYSTAPSISTDGTAIAFWSLSTNLDPKDPDSLEDVYVKHVDTAVLTLASTNGAGVKGNRKSLDPAISADGVRVAFDTFATNFDPRDIDSGIEDVYVKNLVTGELDLLSASLAGTKGNKSSEAPAISSSGLTVAYESRANNLLALDADSTLDIYAKTLS